MAQALEGSVPSLLQGVSQQVPRERLQGQVTAMVNCLADPVSGVRRRPIARLISTVEWNVPEASTTQSLYTQYLEDGEGGMHLCIDTSTGRWWLLDDDLKTEISSGTEKYLLSPVEGRHSIQTTSIGGTTYILNTHQKPEAVKDTTGTIDPSTAGWFFVKSGAFSKRYSVTVASGNNRYEVFYETPKGTDTGDAEKTTPEYISTEIEKKLKEKGLTVYRDGAYLFFSDLENAQVESDAGSTYVGVSGRGRVQVESDLPARLPTQADGYLCSVGMRSTALVWYKFNLADRKWDEAGAYGSVTGIKNMPLELKLDGTMSSPVYEGRLAGDEHTNDDPTFLKDKLITGMSTFQGRLVLLSGAYVCMSKSGTPHRFYRGTVTQLLDADRIDIASGSAQNSVFRSAVQFNRDLIILGDSMQAVVPTGSSLLSPNNASLVLTSELSCDSRVGAVPAGQTMLYFSRRTQNYAGALELIPSQYAGSQYISQDATVHIPKYMAGRVYSASTSTVGNMVVMGCTNNLDSLIVYEYQWGADEKLQSAWHTWQFSLNILGFHFAREKLVLFIDFGTTVGICTVDPREGYKSTEFTLDPLIDYPVPVTVKDGQFGIPQHLQHVHTKGYDLVLARAGSSPDYGAEVGIEEVLAGTGTVTRGVPDGEYTLGCRYRSVLAPTPPMLRDENNKVIGAGSVRLLRYNVTLQHSSEFSVHVVDTSRDVDHSGLYTGMLLNSPELSPDKPLLYTLGSVIVPCRTNADTTEMYLVSSSTREMNVLDISYILKYNMRRRRV